MFRIALLLLPLSACVPEDPGTITCDQALTTFDLEASTDHPSHALMEGATGTRQTFVELHEGTNVPLQVTVDADFTEAIERAWTHPEWGELCPTSDVLMDAEVELIVQDWTRFDWQQTVPLDQDPIVFHAWVPIGAFPAALLPEEATEDDQVIAEVRWHVSGEVAGEVSIWRGDIGEDGLPAGEGDRIDLMVF